MQKAREELKSSEEQDGGNAVTAQKLAEIEEFEKTNQAKLEENQNNLNDITRKHHLSKEEAST